MAVPLSATCGHMTRDLRRALRVAAMVALLFVTSVRESEAQYSSLRICNTGDTVVWVAVVELNDGGLFISDKFNGEGWWEIKPRGCRNVYQQHYLNSSNAWVAFA